MKRIALFVSFLIPFMLSCDKVEEDVKQADESASILGTWELQSVILETSQGKDSEIEREVQDSFGSEYYLVFYEDKALLYVGNTIYETSYIFNEDILKLTFKKTLQAIPGTKYGLNEDTYEVITFNTNELAFRTHAFVSYGGPAYRDTFFFKRKKRQ